MLKEGSVLSAISVRSGTVAKEDYYETFGNNTPSWKETIIRCRRYKKIQESTREQTRLENMKKFHRDDAAVEAQNE